MGPMGMPLLSGLRFDSEANEVYRLPEDKLPKASYMDEKTGEVVEAIDFEHDDMRKIVTKLINHHQKRQVPRLQELRRYYLAQNNIKFRPSKPDEYRADNRIASDWAKYTVTFNRGVIIGNPIQYNGKEGAEFSVDEFNEQVNEHYHNQLMLSDALTFGRAYELIGRNTSGEEWLYKLDVEETFVVFDTTTDLKSLFAVHYVTNEYMGKKYTTIEIYTGDGRLLIFECQGRNYSKMRLVDSKDNYFDAVNINEWMINEERTACFEPIMDDIDAYDLSQSELANFQQDSSDAYLVIIGNPDTGKDEIGENSSGEILDAQRKAHILVLGDRKIYPDGTYGANPDAKYLVKQYDTEGAEKYKERLVNDMIRFCFLVDFQDTNLGGNQSGIGMRFRGWGNDNQRKTVERLVEKSIKRRLRLLAYSWSISQSKDYEKLYDEINSIKIQFTPNIPQADTEVTTMMSNLAAHVSHETVLQIAERITGVKPDDEMKRIESEEQSKVQQLELFDANKIDTTKKEGDSDAEASDPTKQEGHGEAE